MDDRNLQNRFRIELLTLIILAFTFLVLFPQRPTILDVGMALFSLLILGFNINFTKHVVWGQFPLAKGKNERMKACTLATSAITLPLIIAFLGVGLVKGYSTGRWEGVFYRVSNLNILLAMCLYFPWALLQQTLFQFYLLGRLLILFPPYLAITCTGVAFGLVHLPNIWIAVATAAAGIAWTSLYYRYRILTPLALSHAALGSTFYYWLYGRDLFGDWIAFLN